MPNKSQTNDFLKLANLLLVMLSVALCSFLMLFDIPGVELLETNPNWLLIWVVAWSIKRTIWHGAIAGLAIGWIYDGISLSSPSHAASFMFVGVLSSGIQKQKYIGEDFISVAFIVFFMSIFADTIYAWQYTKEYSFSLLEVIQKYQQDVIISAIITSLWSPAFYYPFNLVNEQIKLQVKKFN